MATVSCRIDGSCNWKAVILRYFADSQRLANHSEWNESYSNWKATKLQKLNI